MSAHPSIDASNPEKLRAIVEETLRHNGRTFVGRSPQDRKETRSPAEALLTWLEAHATEEHKILYLTPAPVNSRKTNQDRWNEACNQAREGLERMRRLQTDAEQWRDKLTRAGNAATTGNIQTVCNLDIESAQATVDEAGTINFPKGFGRD